MFPKYCRCCFTQLSILIPLKSSSPHTDGKTYLDYFNFVLGSIALEVYNVSEYICVRCSKALRVAYHFINMVKESWSGVTLNQQDIKAENSEVIFLGNPLEHELPSVYEGIESSQTCIENQLEQFNIEVNPDLTLKQLVSIEMPRARQIWIPDIEKDFKTSQEDIPENNDFNCVICKEIFEDEIAFFEHNRQCHKDIVPLKCKLCRFYTCYMESLSKHYKKDHNLYDMDMNLYQTKQVTVADKNTPNFEITYICLQCDFQSPSQFELDDHLLDEHFIEDDKDLYMNKYVNCTACHRSFVNIKAAKIHYSMYHNRAYRKSKMYCQKKFACEKCGKLFDLKSGLFLHRRVCQKVESVNCNFCKLHFTSVLKYEHHLEEKHLVAIRHECEICGKAFKNSEYLTVHRKRHNERYFQCDLCPKNYISNAELKVHKQRIHSKRQLLKEDSKNIYTCSLCDFKSITRYALQVHQYNHTGKPYKCQRCNKEFVLRKDLRQHCVRHHSITVSNEDMAEMFKQTHGYTSRFDAFSKQNNNLEITEINGLELDGELEEFGLTLQDIMDDLFDDAGDIDNKSTLN